MEIVAEVEAWIASFVVALDLCPFAAAPFGAGRVRTVVSGGGEPAEVLADLLRECQVLDGDDAIETTLLVVPAGFEDFGDYLDLTYAAGDLLVLQDLAERYQIARFHPDWQFEGDAPDDPGNAVGKAPYPILHLLRVESVARAIEAHPDPDGIPERNAALLRSR